MQFDWDVVFDNLDIFGQGLWMTVQLSAVSLVFAVVGGLLVALLRLSRWAVLRALASVFINVLRAIPPFALIIYVYYGIAMAIGVNFTPFFAGVLALSLQYTAWIAEVFRAGIQAVPVGQTEAAHSLGFNGPKTFLTIVLPQAVRIVVPPLGNNVVGLIKDSSLVSYIGVMELIRNSQLLVSQTFRPFEIYTATVVLYLLLTVAVSLLFARLEKKYAVGRPRPGAQKKIGKARAARLKELTDLALTPR